MNYNTPLRYPGGKSKLANFIKLMYETNNLLDGHYVEPYAGGAGIAFSLLFEEFVEHIHINDLSVPIYSFWYSLLNHTDEICKLISDTPVTIDEWKKQKNRLKHLHSSTTLELGFATFFVNRTSRSGIIKNGGPIGGLSQEGKWKLDARYNKKNLIARITRIARHRRRISIYNLDAIKFISTELPSLPKKTLVYFDPPYYVKGQRLYKNHYKHDDHVSLSQQVASSVKHPWIVSYDNTPAIHDLYSKNKTISYDLTYSAAKKYQGSEVMFFSEQLKVPKVENPSKVKFPHQESFF